MVKNKTFWLIAFTAPTMLIFTFIFAVPLITVFVTSFSEYSPFQNPVFIGLDNFKTLFSSEEFPAALKNTALWVILQSTVCIFFGTLVALLLSKKPRGWKFVRASYMIPNIIPTAATGLMFLLLYNPDLGIIKSIYASLGIADSVPNLFGDSTYTFWAVTSTWILYSAINTLLILSEIGAIPAEVFESAKVDGATNLQTDIFITLPLLKNILSTCVILAAVSMIAQFDILYMTTKGGPGTATLNLPIYLFKTANLEMNYGLANSIGVVQIIFGLFLVLVIGRLFKLGQSHK